MGLFISKKEREKRRRKKERMAFREAERVLDSVKDKIRELEHDRQKRWEQAAEYLKAGKKTAARRSMQAVRARELLMDQLEKKSFSCEERLAKLSLASMDRGFIMSLNRITKLMKIDPDELAVTFDKVEEKLDDQEDSNKIWDRMYEKDLRESEYSDSEIVDSVDTLMAQLEEEVAVEVGGLVLENGEVADGIKDEISEGRQRLKDIMEDNK